MNADEFRVSLNIAQIIMLGGVIWGMARMSKTVDDLAKATTVLTRDLKNIGDALSALAGRVMVLEDRSERRSPERRASEPGP